MSKPKKAKRLFVPQHEPGLLPTIERMAKSDYTGAPGNRKKCRHLLSLRRSGDLDSEAETVADRWTNDFQFANFGYADFMRDVVPRDYIRGDVITFAVSRGIAAERIGIVRDTIGVAAHQLLERVLFREESFSSIARDMLPGMDKTSADKAIRQRTVMLLQVLPAAYRAAQKQQEGKRTRR